MKKYFKNRIVKFLIKLAVSLFFIYLVLVKVNWSEAFVYLRAVRISQIIVYLLVLIVGMLISSWKWKILANYKKFELPFLEFFKLYITGAFINNFVPSTIGGDIFRAYQVGKKEGRYFEATSTVVVDRFTGLLSLIIMTPIFSLLNLQKIINIPALIYLNLLMAALLMGFVIFVFCRKFAWAKKIVSLTPRKIQEFVREINSFGNDPRMFIKVMAYALVFNLFGVALANYILFWSLGVSINLLDYLSVIFIISIIKSIPAGIGLNEWSYITLFGFLGINPSAVAMIAILNRFLQALVNVVAFPLYFRAKDKCYSEADNEKIASL